MNLEAEQGTLAALITIDDFLHTLPISIVEDDFQSSTCQAIAKSVLSIIEEGKKPTKTLIESTAKHLAIPGWEELTKSGDSIEDIINIAPTEEEAINYVKHLKKARIRTVAVDKMRGLAVYMKETDDNLATMLAKLEDTVLSVTTSVDFSDEAPVSLAEGIEEELMFYGENPGLNGLDIGMPNWQDKIGGVAPGLVHMIIATHKTGKSNIGMNAAMAMAQHIPVLFVDTEMDASKLRARTFSILTNIATNTLIRGHWQSSEHDDFKYNGRVKQGIEEYVKYNITYISGRGKQVTDLVPAMRRWVLQNKAAAEGKFPQGLIIYDYVKLASYGDLKQHGLQEYQLLGLNMSTLKDFCGKYKVPCITFGQTNRESDETINCMGASKRFGDLVDSVSLFKKKTPEDLVKDPHGSHLLKVFIARHGTGTEDNEHIQMNYDKMTGRMQELNIFKFKGPPESSTKFKGKKKAKSTHTASTDEIIDEAFGSNT